MTRPYGRQVLRMAVSKTNWSLWQAVDIKLMSDKFSKGNSKVSTTLLLQLLAVPHDMTCLKLATRMPFLKNGI